jgi:hypothetical protein
MHSNWSCRSQIFYKVFCFKLAVEAFTPQLALALLEHSLWLPYLLYVLALTISLPLVYLILESLLAKAAALEEAQRSGSISSLDIRPY